MSLLFLCPKQNIAIVANLLDDFTQCVFVNISPQCMENLLFDAVGVQ